MSHSPSQKKETYTALIRRRLPKYEKPKIEWIEHLSPSIIIDQTRFGGKARSTVDTISDCKRHFVYCMHASVAPYDGTASYGMVPPLLPTISANPCDKKRRLSVLRTLLFILSHHKHISILIMKGTHTTIGKLHHFADIDTTLLKCLIGLIDMFCR